jgi:hypothetical protein
VRATRLKKKRIKETNKGRREKRKTQRKKIDCSKPINLELFHCFLVVSSEVRKENGATMRKVPYL